MNRILFLLIIFCPLKAYTQNYHITFKGTGASTNVSTVKVENLTARTSLIVSGSDILRLISITTGVSSILNNQLSGIKIYPNPMTDNSIIEIFPPQSGDASISVYEISGKIIAKIQNYIENTSQKFRISGLNTGLYLISVKGNSYHYSGILLSINKATGTINIHKISSNEIGDEKVLKMVSKGTQAIVDMAYTSGDRLKFTGISGNYSTIKTDIPVGDELITFNFIACADGDNNNYSVVEIGTQFWMAENLKTTKYRNGDLIGTTTPATLDISGESTPKYQWAYNGNETNIATYGRLYTWFAITDSRNICPIGWHVSTDAEWTILTTYLGGDFTGGKLKETGQAHWEGGNIGATNETGFTALPGGTRDGNGTWFLIGDTGYWWCSTEYNELEGYRRILVYNDSYVYRGDAWQGMGHSVRCTKD